MPTSRVWIELLVHSETSTVVLVLSLVMDAPSKYRFVQVITSFYQHPHASQMLAENNLVLLVTDSTYFPKLLNETTNLCIDKVWHVTL